MCYVFKLSATCPLCLLYPYRLRHRFAVFTKCTHLTSLLISVSYNMCGCNTLKQRWLYKFPLQQALHREAFTSSCDFDHRTPGAFQVTHPMSVIRGDAQQVRTSSGAEYACPNSN